MKIVLNFRLHKSKWLEKSTVSNSEGNPNIKKYGLTTDWDEALTDNMSIRMPPSVMKRLKEQKNWREFVRSTLIKALEVQEKESEQDSRSHQ